MRSLWCKIWNFVLNTFMSAIEAVAYALKTAGVLLVEVFDAVLTATSDALGIGKLGTLGLIALGVGAWFLLGGSDDDKNSNVRDVTDLNGRMSSYVN